MNDFSHDALALNCELIALKKLNMGRVPPAQFPWQQQYHSR